MAMTGWKLVRQDSYNTAYERMYYKDGTATVTVWSHRDEDVGSVGGYRWKIDRPTDGFVTVSKRAYLTPEAAVAAVLKEMER